MIDYRYDTQLLIEGTGLDEDAINDYFRTNFQGDCLLHLPLQLLRHRALALTIGRGHRAAPRVLHPPVDLKQHGLQLLMERLVALGAAQPSCAGKLRQRCLTAWANHLLCRRHRCSIPRDGR